jgi:phage/plasmid-associated DNA primase
MNGLLDQVFPYPDERKLYLIVLASGLCGKTLEKFINANGNGGNGKGFLNELAQCVMGNYAYTCGNNVLLNPIKAGNNPEVANMNHKRIVFYREPDTSQNQKLNVATVKELTGGKEINARLNYSNDTKCNLKATHILECNERPKLSGKIDDAVVRRLIDIPFRSTFTKNPDDYAGDHVFQGNDTVKTYIFQQDHKSALFHIILEHWKLYFDANEDIDTFIPSSVKERTKLYLESNDEIKEWFDTEFEKADKDSYVQIKDVYDSFVISELFQNLSKKERRENSKKTFTDKIITNINFKKCFKEVHQPYINGKQIKVRQVLMGWKAIPKELIEPEDAEPLEDDQCKFNM